jgi:uncharacterized protein (TIGR02453 family)
MPLPDVLPPFPGFRAEGLQFLRDLSATNEREWFKPRKAVYDDELLWPARCLVAQIAAEAPAAGLPLAGDPSKSVFRIYRDTRFSKNKAPYKTHVGMYLTPSGAKDDEGGVYVHVEPGASFLAAGFWNPERPWLARFRERLAADAGGWLAVVHDVEAAGLTLGVGPQDALKRMPRGYESLAESDVALYLKWKGVVASRPLPDDALASTDLPSDVLAFAADARPLLDWGWALKTDG